MVNPNLPGERFGSRALAGVGVAFYVMAALTHRLRELGELPAGASANPADLLDLVALGTVADVVPLDFNNRVLVAQGSGASAPAAARRARGAARGRRTTSRRRGRAGFGLPGGTPAQCRRAARGHDTRRRVPAHRRRRGGARHRRAALRAQQRTTRHRGAHAGRGARTGRGHPGLARGRAAGRTVPARCGLAPGRDRARGVADQGAPAATGDRLRAGRRRLAQGLGAVGAGPARARRARRGAAHHPGLLERFGATRWPRG